MRYRIACLLVLMLASVKSIAETGDAAKMLESGRAVYRYYCYQCHGYSGNAETVASAYLNPAPRNFTATTKDALQIPEMIAAVRRGKAGTAMVAFASVLTDAEICGVVAYIRGSFMSSNPRVEQYHTEENGWPDHSRYGSAFPFVDGSIAITTAFEALTRDQQKGRNLYVSACISCHDQPSGPVTDPVWELQAASYPRKHYSHISGPADLVSGASPYVLHDISPRVGQLSPGETAGKQLYEENCAFCHAADGSGRNWIGSFLDPRPRDFTEQNFELLQHPKQLASVIRSGVPNSSMPAWQAVLSDAEIAQIIDYMQLAFGSSKR